MKYRRQTSHIPSQPEKGFSEKLAPKHEGQYFRYRPDFAGPATNFTEVGGWRMAMDNDLRKIK